MVNNSADQIPQEDVKRWLETDMWTAIPEPTLTTLLSSPPFITIPGILNFRDLSLTTPSYIQPGLLFRSGALDPSLPPASTAVLQDSLGIKLILDLRSDREVARAPDPQIPGIENLWMKTEREPTPIQLEKYMGNGKGGYVQEYEQILEIYTGSIREALRWVRDAKGPMLFHCSGAFQPKLAIPF